MRGLRGPPPSAWYTGYVGLQRLLIRIFSYRHGEDCTMTVVLDWCLGDSGSATSPAIGSLTPLEVTASWFPICRTSHWCLCSVWSPFTALLLGQAPLRLPEWQRCVWWHRDGAYLFTELQIKKKNQSMFPLQFCIFFLNFFFSCVFQHQLPSSPFSLENAVGGLLEVEPGSCRVPSLGFGERCSSGFTHSARQAHIPTPPAATSTWGGAHPGWPPLEGPGGDAQTLLLLRDVPQCLYLVF